MFINYWEETNFYIYKGQFFQYSNSSFWPLYWYCPFASSDMPNLPSDLLAGVLARLAAPVAPVDLYFSTARRRVRRLLVDVVVLPVSLECEQCWTKIMVDWAYPKYHAHDMYRFKMSPFFLLVHENCFCYCYFNLHHHPAVPSFIWEINVANSYEARRYTVANE